MASTSSTATGRSVSCSGVRWPKIETSGPNGMIAKLMKAGVTANTGARMKTSLSTPIGTTSSFSPSLIPSATDCSNPNHPVRHRGDFSGDRDGAAVGGHRHLVTVGYADLGRRRPRHPGAHGPCRSCQEGLAVGHPARVEQLMPGGEHRLAVAWVRGDSRGNGWSESPRTPPRAEPGQFAAGRRCVRQTKMHVHLI